MSQYHVDEALKDWLLMHADDQFIMAHRASEWTGHAPILEEDIALANIAQDELGHATLWYNLLAELNDAGDDYPDQLVFARGAEGWRNLRLVELPNGDWAFTMLRQYLLDVYEHVLLEQLLRSCHEGVATVAAKIQREELYHLRHSTAWLRRLALGTGESHARTQYALDEQWPYVAQLWLPLPAELLLVGTATLPSTTTLAAAWEALVLPLLADCGLRPPDLAATTPGGRELHTPHLAALLADMQSVARLDPQAEW